jgi:alkylation response protein AidB-like acyl-CoA dehydrogenase
MLWLAIGAASANEGTLGSPAAELSALQQMQSEGRDVFVLQKELDPVIRQGGGGACASAAAIDAIQTLRVMTRQEPLPNPHEAALAAIGRQEELLNGRVTDEQLAELLQQYATNHLQGWRLGIGAAPSPHAPVAQVEQPWSVVEGPNLTAADGELKIITYHVTTADGVTLGRHFVLLKRIERDNIAVVDPGSPTKDRTYSVRSRDENGWGRRVFLVPPANVSTTATLEVDTVFTLRLAKSEAAYADPLRVNELKQKIDEAAATLRASNELRSPRTWRKTTASFGLPGLDLPKEYGGSGWTALQTLEAFLHAGRHDLNCRDVVGGAHVRPLMESKSPQASNVIRQVAEGKAYMAITMTEPTAGSDYHAIKSTAQKVDGGYLLNGEKRYVARLEQATHVIVFTQPANGKPEGLSAFVLPIDTPGLDRYSFGAHGLKGNSFGGLRLNNVQVADWQLVGADGEGDKLFEKHFRYWRLMQVGAALGTAERALEMMVERLVTREAFGAPIGRFSHLQQAVGQRTTELRMAKALAREAAAMLDRGEGPAADAIINGLKAEGVEIALATVDAATRAFGAEGYSDQVDLGDRLQDLNGLRIADGTTDVMRMSVVAKSYGENGRRLWKMAVKGER